MHPETVCAAGNSHAWLVVLSTQARLGASEILAVSWRRGPGRSHGASVGVLSAAAAARARAPAARLRARACVAGGAREDRNLSRIETASESESFKPEVPVSGWGGRLSVRVPVWQPE